MLLSSCLKRAIMNRIYIDDGPYDIDLMYI